MSGPFVHSAEVYIIRRRLRERAREAAGGGAPVRGPENVPLDEAGVRSSGAGWTPTTARLSGGGARAGHGPYGEVGLRPLPRGRRPDVSGGYALRGGPATTPAERVSRRGAASSSAPSMGIDSEVKVLSKIGHSDRSEPQGRNREGPSGGSGERTRGPTYRNRIRGGAEQGERAGTREALVTEARRRISGGRAGKVDVLTWGDLAPRPKGRRRTGVPPGGARSQQRP
jgi:hypothetical protein